jgi:hypothetical protein
VTRDGGQKWTEVSAKLGLAGPRWIASVEPSRYVDGRAYVALDGHRSNDDEPYIYVTEDFGETWKSLRGNLPWGSTRVCREDIHNANMIYTGTEFGIYVSANRGVSWTKLNSNLPTVAIHEIAQHPTNGEMVVATHGRSLWVVDVTPLRQFTNETLKAAAHLYEPNTAVRWRVEAGRENWFNESDRRFAGANPVRSAQIYYSLCEKAKTASLKIMDHTGKVLAELPTSTETGLHLAAWNLSQGRTRGPGRGMSSAGGRGTRRSGGPPDVGQRGAGPERRAEAPGERPSQPGESSGTPPSPEEPAESSGPPMVRGPISIVPAGDYRIVLDVDGKELVQWLRVENDPVHPGAGMVVQEIAQPEEDEDEDP